jgi:hypothetical protein
MTHSHHWCPSVNVDGTRRATRKQHARQFAAKTSRRQDAGSTAASNCLSQRGGGPEPSPTNAGQQHISVERNVRTDHTSRQLRRRNTVQAGTLRAPADEPRTPHFGMSLHSGKAARCTFGTPRRTQSRNRLSLSASERRCLFRAAITSSSTKALKSSTPLGERVASEAARSGAMGKSHSWRRRLPGKRCSGPGRACG